MVRTIHRIPAEDQWIADEVLAVTAVPRRPNPNRGGGEPEPRLHTKPVDDHTSGDVRADGTGLGRPECSGSVEGLPSEFTITDRLLGEFDRTLKGAQDACKSSWTEAKGCTATRAGKESMRR